MRPRVDTLASPGRVYLRLVRHFIASLFQSGESSSAEELDLSTGGLLALLALPGAFLSLLLFDKYSSLMEYFGRHPRMDPYVVSLPDKYFFLVFAMVITGVVTVLRWDRILPGRQDHANLAPLPIAPLVLFAANLTAILLSAAVFAVDVNAASVVLFPLVVAAERGTAGQWVQFMGAHALCLFLASVFAFFACFSVMGLLMALLPARALQRVALPVRIVLVTLLLALLTTSFAVPSLFRQLSSPPPLVLRCLPPAWFLGLYQTLQGRGGPAMQQLADLGWQALFVVITVALLSYAVSYRRHFVRIPESRESQPPLFRRFAWRFPDWWIADPVQRGLARFVSKTLLRSEPHCLLVGASLGWGLVLASQTLTDELSAQPAPTNRLPTRDLLSLPLMLAYCLLCGLRASFELPATWRAHWFFPLLVPPDAGPARAVARRLLWMAITPFVLLPCALVLSLWWDWRIALFHTLVVIALSALLIECLLLRLHKIPFTCTLPPFRNYVIVLALLFVVGYFVFTGLGGALAYWLMQQPLRIAALPVAAWALRIVWRRWKEETGILPLVYEERAEPAVQRLRLFDQ